MTRLIQSLEELFPAPILSGQERVRPFIDVCGDGSDYEYGDCLGSGKGNGQASPFCSMGGSMGGDGDGAGTFQGTPSGNGHSYADSRQHPVARQGEA